MNEPSRITIDGRPVIVYDRPKPIPESLQLMLEGGRDSKGRLWTALRVSHRTPLRLGLGATSGCLAEDHRMSAWLRGFHLGSDGIARDLNLLACVDCGAVCVRDVSFDILPTARPARLAPRRRDDVVGWYAGSRPNQRVYT